jgi:tetratricopeptide (TPR) repeat protein
MVEYQIQPNPNIGELFELIKTAEACIQIESLLIVSKLILSSQQFGHPHWLPAIASSIDFLENTIDKTDAVQCARLSELIALFHFNKKDYAQSAKIFDGICELLESQKSEFPQNFITELLLESAVVSSNTGSTAETFRKFVTAAQTEHGAEDDAIRLAEIYAYFGCFLMKTDVKKAFAAFDKALDYYNQLPENSKLERLVVLRYMHMLVTQGAVKADLKSLADQIDCCLQGS